MGQNPQQTGLMVVGTVVGGVLGGPAGASLGLALGSMTGQMLFAEDLPTIHGPRIGDSRISGASYGVPISQNWGTMRLGGNMIWTSGIEERKKKKKISGKGGPSQSEVTYTYFASFAMAFGAGTAKDVLRIWADNKLIFDSGVTTLSQQSITEGVPVDMAFTLPQPRKYGLNFRFYPGDEEQLPDPVMSAHNGASVTPAYRGTCYIVFENLPLGEYGNRIPNITAEIAYETIEARMSRQTTAIAGGISQWQSDLCAVDWDRGYYYAYGIDVTKATSDPERTYIRKFRLSDLQEVFQINAANSLNNPAAAYPVFSDQGGGMICLHNGDLVLKIQDSVSAGNSKPLVRLDGNTLREKARFGLGNSSVNMSNEQFEVVTRMAPISVFGPMGKEDYILCGSLFSSLGLLNVSGSDKLEYVWDSDNFSGSIVTDDRIRSVCGGQVAEGWGDAYALGWSATTSSDPVNVYRIRVSSNAVFSILSGIQTVTGVDFELMFTLTPNDLFPGETQLSNAEGLIYDQTDDCILLFAANQLGTEHRWFKYNPRTGQQVWKSAAFSATYEPANERFGQQSRLEDGVFGYVVGSRGLMLDTQTGETLVDTGVTSPDFTHDADTGLGFFDSRTEIFIGVGDSTEDAGVMFFFRRKVGQPAKISTIIKSIGDRIGLSASDFETTDIDDLTVHGYSLGRQSSARSAILPLTQVYLLEGFESEDKLKFVKRGGSVVKTIPQADLVAKGSSGEFLNITRTQEVELPRRMTLTYLDHSNAYQQNAHHAKRIQDPSPVMQSDHEVNIEFPGAIDVTFAKQQAEKALYASWSQRDNYAVPTSWSHVDLEPGDVINVTLENGTTFRMMIRTIDVGSNLEVEINGIGEVSGLFTSAVLGDPGSGMPGQVVRSSVYVTGKILDVPLLRDADEVPSRAANPIYALMGAYQDGQFLSGTLYKSLDNVEFTDLNYFVSEMAWGTVLNALGDPSEEDLWSIDMNHTITVRMTSGASQIESVTQLEMLNGANPAAILKTNGEIEVIQFQTVVENADGSFTLSNLLRGRRGTDTMAFDHTSSETFVLLDSADIEKFNLTLSELNQLRYYRSVGAGQLIELSELQTLTSQHRALKPYAVAQIKAAPGASDSIDFSWVRRTRVGGPLLDGFGVVPLSEDSEAYEIDILDSPGGSVVRTVTGLTSPAYNYTSANQTTDGFTPPLSSVTVRIYQISAQVGRGFAREITVNVE